MSNFDKFLDNYVKTGEWDLDIIKEGYSDATHRVIDEGDFVSHPITANFMKSVKGCCEECKYWDMVAEKEASEQQRVNR